MCQISTLQHNSNEYQTGGNFTDTPPPSTIANQPPKKTILMRVKIISICINFAVASFCDRKKLYFAWYLISRFGNCKTFHGYFNFAILVKIKTKVSLNINFSIINQCDCYEICYRNSSFIAISRDMLYMGINIIV